MRTNQDRNMGPQENRDFSRSSGHRNGSNRFDSQDIGKQSDDHYRYLDNSNNYENKWDEQYDDYSYYGEWQNEPKGYNSAYNEGDDVNEDYGPGSYQVYGNSGSYAGEPGDDWDYYDTGSYRSQGGYPEHYQEELGRNINDSNRYNKYSQDYHRGYIRFIEGPDRFSNIRDHMEYTGMDR
jgi:hypothetical protein